MRANTSTMRGRSSWSWQACPSLPYLYHINAQLRPMIRRRGGVKRQGWTDVKEEIRSAKRGNARAQEMDEGGADFTARPSNKNGS